MRSSVLVRFVCTVDSPRSSLVELPQYPGCWHRARAGAGVSRRGRSSPSRPGGCGAWRARVVPGTARLEIRAESIYTIYDTCVVSILLVLIYSNPVRALISIEIDTYAAPAAACSRTRAPPATSRAPSLRVSSYRTLPVPPPLHTPVMLHYESITHHHQSAKTMAKTGENPHQERTHTVSPTIRPRASPHPSLS
jgi:hypothetical protein